jgi:energy-coupling factor transporter ATP-binding protein EcfA2
MKRLRVQNFGPIRDGEVEFGDLTVLVGPQASGKSIFVQLLKAIEDAAAIRKALKDHGFEWQHGGRARQNFSALYFGEGMDSLWRADAAISVDGKRFDFDRNVVGSRPGIASQERVFFVPAQRVLVLQDGWPSPAMDRSVEAPYCTRNFCETLRELLDRPRGEERAVFPQRRRLKEEFRRLLNQGIYDGGQVRLDRQGMRKRLVLQPKGAPSALPYSVWSAGQREFTPLLLGLYWLMPPTKITKRPEIETVVIEEPEMGLHPQAIVSFCLLALELLHRGYKVIISTHSPVVLDVVWALRELRDCKRQHAVRALCDIFALENPTPPTRQLLADALRTDCRTYFFGRTRRSVRVYDISTLDPGDPDAAVSGWGGLSGFSGQIADIVGNALNRGRVCDGAS